MKLFVNGAFTVGVIALGLSVSPVQAQITEVPYLALTGTQFVTFDDVAADNYNSVFYSNGVGFGERFVGQTLTYDGDFDVIGGAPSGNSLTLQAGAADQNLDVFEYNGTNTLAGLGHLGYPNFDAIGEGSFAALFSSGQSQFGFQLVGGDGGDATVSFFRGDGSLIEAMTLTNLANDYYGFQRDGGVNDIRGISIYNSDPGGIAFDNLRFDVASSPPAGAPAPLAGAGLLSFFGASGLALRKRVQRVFGSLLSRRVAAA